MRSGDGVLTPRPRISARDALRGTLGNGTLGNGTLGNGTLGNGTLGAQRMQTAPLVSASEGVRHPGDQLREDARELLALVIVERVEDQFPDLRDVHGSG